MTVSRPVTVGQLTPVDGEGWEQMRDAVASSDGWGLGLGNFAGQLGN